MGEELAETLEDIAEGGIGSRCWWLSRQAGAGQLSCSSSLHRYWARQRETTAEALRLAADLLPDRVRVLGPDHPGTLATRANIAYWTEQLSASAQHPEGTIDAEDPGNTATQAE